MKTNSKLVNMSGCLKVTVVVAVAGVHVVAVQVHSAGINTRLQLQSNPALYCEVCVRISLWVVYTLCVSGELCVCVARVFHICLHVGFFLFALSLAFFSLSV